MFKSALLVFGLLNVLATCQCISGMDLLGQFYVCHTEIEVADQTFPSHTVTVY